MRSQKSTTAAASETAAARGVFSDTCTNCQGDGRNNGNKYQQVTLRSTRI
jgi:cytochrome c5